MKKMVFGISILLVLVLALTLLPTACSTPSSTPTPAPTTTAAKTSSNQRTPATTAAPASSSTAPTSAAGAVIKLKFGSLYTAPHFRALTDAVWIDKIQKETNGRVQIDYYPGATWSASRPLF